MSKVPTLHIPMRLNSVSKALSESKLTIQGKKDGDITKYFYKQ